MYIMVKSYSILAKLFLYTNIFFYYLEIIIPNEINTIDFRINDLWDSDTDEKIEFVNPGKLGQTVKMKLPIDVKPGWILRRRK